jgi:hypothetical protein
MNLCSICIPCRTFSNNRLLVDKKMKNEMGISEQDYMELRNAKALLENPGLVAKITSMVGTPIEKGLEMLPANWQAKVGDVTQDALMYALKGALLTMKDTQSGQSYPRLHKIATTVSGAATGAFGLPGLIVDLPLSSLIMLRSIADIARANGEALDRIEVRLACLEVFAMGGPSKSDDAAESGYFAVRAALAKAVTDASKYLVEKMIIEEGAPALLRLITLIATRFQVQVTEKAAAMLVPIVGAVGGGVINLLFIDHFQDMSRGHFTIRRLERKYGTEIVRTEYERIVLPLREAQQKAA